jgi:CHAP domain
MYRLLRQPRSYVQRHFKAISIVATTAACVLGANYSLVSHASTTNTRADAWGTVEVGATDANNVGGSGVDVYSNGASPFYTPNKPNNTVGGVVSGEKWQCVELINRLYLAKGWTTANWPGNGNQIYANAPGSLAKEANGNINSLNAGDVLSLDYSDGYGHTSIVSSVNGTSVTIINQNTMAVYSAATYQNKTLTLSAWTNYSVIGVIHRPTGGGGGGTVSGDPHSFADSTNAMYAKGARGAGGWVQQVGGGNVTKFAMGANYQIFLRGDGTVFAKNDLKLMRQRL